MEIFQIPVPVSYEEFDAVQIQFRLPSGQKCRHRFSPQSKISEIFQTASSLTQIPIGHFQLRTAEVELDEKVSEFDIKSLHNTMITIIK